MWVVLPSLFNTLLFCVAFQSPLAASPVVAASVAAATSAPVPKPMTEAKPTVQFTVTEKPATSASSTTTSEVSGHIGCTRLCNDSWMADQVDNDRLKWLIVSYGWDLFVRKWTWAEWWSMQGPVLTPFYSFFFFFVKESSQLRHRPVAQSAAESSTPKPTAPSTTSVQTTAKKTDSSNILLVVLVAVLLAVAAFQLLNR